MDNITYTAFLGMRARQRALDTVANNIANASTVGFKAERVLWQSVANLEGQNNPNVNVNKNENNQAANDAATNQSARDVRSLGVMTTGATDFSSGAIRPTGRALDVALVGDGFLTVQTPQGERYTRGGALTLDNAGQLVTQSGDLVIGARGAVTIPAGEVSIAEDGSISINNQTIAKLKITRFANPQTALQHEGATLFVTTGSESPQEDFTTRVEGGALESSNVSAMSEMVQMMQHNREFESIQKTISLVMNDLGRKVSSEIGKL